MQPVMLCILTVLETVVQEKLLQEQITEHSEARVPGALWEDRRVLKGSPVPWGVSAAPTQAPQPQHWGSIVSPSPCPALGWRSQGC